MMKKLFCILLVAMTAVLALFASGSKEGEDSGVVTIDVWHSMEGSNGQVMSSLIQKFNETKGKELGIVANDVFQGSDTAVKLKTCIQTNDIENMPDVCQIYNASLPVIDATNCAVDIDSMWGKGSASVEKTDLIDSGIYCYTYEGRLLSMPFNTSTILLYCNLDAFAEAGLSEADLPRTWDDVYEIGQKLIKLDEDGNVLRYGVNWQLARYELFDVMGVIGENGTAFADNNNGRDGLVSKVICREEMLQVFKMWEKFSKVPGLLNDSGSDQSGNFASGLNAMALRSSAGIGAITQMTDANGMHWAAAKLPVFNVETDKGGAALGGASLAMFDRGDEAKKNADTFLTWLFSSETGKKIVKENLMFITPFNSFTEEELPEDPLAKEVNRWMNMDGVTSVPWAFQGIPSEQWKQDFGGALLQYINGSMDWSAVVETARNSWSVEAEIAGR